VVSRATRGDSKGAARKSQAAPLLILALKNTHDPGAGEQISEQYQTSESHEQRSVIFMAMTLVRKVCIKAGTS